MATEKIHMCLFAKVQRPQSNFSEASGYMYDYIVRSSLPVSFGELGEATACDQADDHLEPNSRKFPSNKINSRRSNVFLGLNRH